MRRIHPGDRKKMSRTKKIYAVRCEPNGKIYVGQSVDPKERMKDHLFFLKSEKTTWNNDLKMYGKNNFRLYILEDNVPYERCNERETYWIKRFNAFNPNYGYNVAKPCFRRYEWKQ